MESTSHSEIQNNISSCEGASSNVQEDSEEGSKEKATRTTSRRKTKKESEQPIYGKRRGKRVSTT